MLTASPAPYLFSLAEVTLLLPQHLPFLLQTYKSFFTLKKAPLSLLPYSFHHQIRKYTVSAAPIAPPPLLASLFVIWLHSPHLYETNMMMSSLTSKRPNLMKASDSVILTPHHCHCPFLKVFFCFLSQYLPWFCTLSLMTTLFSKKTTILIMNV